MAGFHLRTNHPIVIIESIVTSIDAAGTVNCAPMGVEWGDEAIVLKPFLDTATYRNVTATGAAVVNLVDDVRVFARAAISNPQYATVPATTVPGVRLADCCSWREVRVRSIDRTPPRSRIETEVGKVLRSFGRPHTDHATTGPTHIFNLGHGISQFTPPEHVATLVEAVHRQSRALRA